MPDSSAGSRPNAKNRGTPSSERDRNETQPPQSHRGRLTRRVGPPRLRSNRNPHVSESSAPVNQVLEWNQIFIDTLIATNTANSSSQRLGAIVHTAIFDAYNGIQQRYAPVFIHNRPHHGTSRRAAVIAAAYTALAGLFPTRLAELEASYDASLAALSNDCEHRGQSHAQRRCAVPIERGIAWGTEVAQAVLAWRATDGFNATYPAFAGGTAVGQWRPTPPAWDDDERARPGLHRHVRARQRNSVSPGPPRGLMSSTLHG